MQELIEELISGDNLLKESSATSHTFGYSNGHSDVEWNVDVIWKAVESLPITRIHISELEEYINHVRSDYDKDDYDRIKEADTRYPPIISKYKGNITTTSGKVIQSYLVIDGFHRLCKLLDSGKKVIDVKVIDKMPPLHIQMENHLKLLD